MNYKNNARNPDNASESKKEQLLTQNRELKAQIADIKQKISSIKQKAQDAQRNLIKANFSSQQNNNNNNDNNISYKDELTDLSNKVNFYIDEISKKKCQVDNMVSLTYINNLKQKIKEQNELNAQLKNDNVSLIRVYNNQVKSINTSSMKYDLNLEEDLNDKIKNKKTELKSLDDSNTQLNNQLKEQRIMYSNLNETIKQMKLKLKTIKSKKNISNVNDNNEYDLNEKIIQLQNQINEQNKLTSQEQKKYKSMLIKNENEINRLSDIIYQKEEQLKEKGNELRLKQIQIKKGLIHCNNNNNHHQETTSIESSPHYENENESNEYNQSFVSLHMSNEQKDKDEHDKIIEEIKNDLQKVQIDQQHKQYNKDAKTFFITDNTKCHNANANANHQIVTPIQSN